MVSLTSWMYASAPAQATSNARPSSPTTPPAAVATPSPERPTPSRNEGDSTPRDHDRLAHSSPLPSLRAVKQFGLFLGGAGFMLFSLRAARRAITRHRVMYRPKFFQLSSWDPLPADRLPAREPMVAFEALQLATLNVISFGTMMTGGLCFAFDISSLDDLRAIARRKLGHPGSELDEAAEREVAEWMARTTGFDLAKFKGGKEKEGEGGR